MMIDTAIGPMDDKLLERRDLGHDNDNECTSRTEYYFMGRLIRSDVHVHLKKGLPELLGVTQPLI